jgi:Phosphodiester glycosidase/FlgD Ig-like domain
MARRACLAVLLAALALPGAAVSATSSSELVPGITYTREDRWTPEGPLVIHVLTGPPPGGLHTFRPVLAHDRIGGRETVSSMQRRLSGAATLAGINGDFFGWLTGAPSGLVVRKAVLASTPGRNRSNLGIAAGGLLRVARTWHTSSWTVPGYRPLRLNHVNKRLADPGVTLFTPTWGSPTPAIETAVDVVLTDVPKLVPARDLVTKAYAVRRGGGTVIPAGGAVLQARGLDWVKALTRRARPGRAVSIRVDLRNWWTDVANAIGGGPLLVKDGVPVLSAGEAFTSYVLDLRHPRTAVGQLADGRIVLVAVDGRSWFSSGLRMWELAEEMARLGAVTAMALDGGGSTTIAFDGDVLNRPSDGSERPVSNALMFLYHGIYANKPRHRTFSPNGDGVADVQSLSAKIVRPSTVDLVLVQPDGAVAWRYQGPLAAGTVAKAVTSPLLPEGRWRWIAYALDDRGRESLMERRFTLNNTIGYLMLSKARMAVAPRTGGRLVASVRVARAAEVTVLVRTGDGRLVRQLFSAILEPGRYAVVWDGKNGVGKVVPSGTYTVRVDAVNELGQATLRRQVVVIKQS